MLFDGAQAIEERPVKIGLSVGVRCSGVDELRNNERLGGPLDVGPQAGERLDDLHLRHDVQLAALGKDDLATAEQLARESVALAGASDFYLAHADALMDLAEVLAIRERPVEAAQCVSEAITLYERKGNGLAATGARERLAGLTE